MVSSIDAAIGRNIYLDVEVAFPLGPKRELAWAVDGRQTALALELDAFFAEARTRRHARAARRALLRAARRGDAHRRRRVPRPHPPGAAALAADVRRRAGSDRHRVAAARGDRLPGIEVGSRSRPARPACAASCSSPRTRRGASASPTGSTRARACSRRRATSRTSRTACPSASPSPTARGSRSPRSTSGSATSRTRASRRSATSSIPDRWHDVRRALPLLALPEYYEKARLGYARGGMPVAFVDRVRAYYDILLRNESPHQPRLRAETPQAGPWPWRRSPMLRAASPLAALAVAADAGARGAERLRRRPDVDRASRPRRARARRRHRADRRHRAERPAHGARQAQRARAACSPSASRVALGNALVAPVVAYVPEGGVAPPTAHMRFPGTITVPTPAFEATLESTAQSFKLARLPRHRVRRRSRRLPARRSQAVAAAAQPGVGEVAGARARGRRVLPRGRDRLRARRCARAASATTRSARTPGSPTRRSRSRSTPRWCARTSSPRRRARRTGPTATRGARAPSSARLGVNAIVARTVEAIRQARRRR